MGTLVNQTMQMLSPGITGQGSMLDTSVTRDIVWLVQRSEDVYPAVNGVDMHRNVSHQTSEFCPKNSFSFSFCLISSSIRYLRGEKYRCSVLSEHPKRYQPLNKMTNIPTPFEWEPNLGGNSKRFQVTV